MSQETVSTPVSVAYHYAESLRRFGLDEDYISRISRVTSFVCSATLQARSELGHRELTTDDISTVVDRTDDMLKVSGVEATPNEVYALSLMTLSGQFGEFECVRAASDAMSPHDVPNPMINAESQYEGEK